MSRPLLWPPVRGAAVSRRGMLRLGGAALAAPFLPGLVDRRALAQESGPGPKRLVVFHWPQGTVMRDFVPTAGPDEPALSSILEPLAAFRDRMITITGIDNRMPALNTVGNAHENATFTHYSARPFPVQDASALTSGGPTIEQLIASRMSSGHPYPRLDFAIGGASASGFTTQGRFYYGQADPVSSFNEPEVAIQRIFGDASMSPADAAALRAQRASVLDAVLGSFGQVRRGLDSAGKARLDAHMEKVAQLEARIGSGVGECSAPPYAPDPGYRPTTDDDLTAPMINDIVSTALSCDYAPVVTIDYANGHDHAFPWLWAENGGPIVDTSVWDNWHAMVHADHQPGMERVYRWYMTMLADLLARMDGMVDGDGDNLLDTSLVLAMSEFSSGRHWTTSVPTLLIGTMGDVEMGRWIDHLSVDAETFQESGGYELSGVCTNQLYTSLLHAFGGSDETFGSLEGGLPAGPLPGL